MPALGSLGARQKHQLPDLPYDYGALEPHINAQIMQLHHSKHHAAYVNNLNATEDKYREALQKGRCGPTAAPRTARPRGGRRASAEAPVFARLRALLKFTGKGSLWETETGSCLLTNV